MKFSSLVIATALFIPALAFAEASESSPTPPLVAGEQCISVQPEAHASKPLKEMADSMGLELGVYDAVKISGVVRGRLMYSSKAVEVCIKASESSLTYQVRSHDASARHQDWVLLSSN